jgi:hypothetical protein
MSRRREQDDDLGFRTPTKRPTKKRSATKKRERSSRERDDRDREGEGKRKRRSKSDEHSRKRKRKSGEANERPSKRKRKSGEANERPRKRKTGEHRAVPSKAVESKAAEEQPQVSAKAETKKTPRPDRSAKDEGERRRPGVAIVAGLLATALVGGLALMLLMGDPPEQNKPQTAQITPQQAPAPTRKAQQPSVAAPVTQPQPKASAARPVRTPVAIKPPAARPKAAPTGMSLEELAKKSATHAAVARILEDHMALFDPATLRAPGPNFQPFHERRRKEEELLQRLRQMGPLAVDALKEMLLALGNRHQQIFLGKAVAGIEGPEAGAAVRQILGEVKDMSIQLALTRHLPEGSDSADLLARAFGEEENSNLRSMLLREYNHRLQADDSGELFRSAAQDKDPRVRAEAVTILGRRGRAEDASLLEDIVANEKDPNIRKRAIVSLAETAKGNALTTLESVARDPKASLGERASVVLGVGKVGGEQAIHLLEQIGSSDPSPQIRQRANQTASNLRRNLNRSNSADRVDAPPVRIGPSSEPLERR